MPDPTPKTMEDDFGDYITRINSETDIATKIKSLGDIARLAARQRELQDTYENDLGISAANAVAVRFIAIVMNATLRAPHDMEVNEPFMVVRYQDPNVSFAVDGNTLDLWWEEDDVAVLVTNRELVERLLTALTPPGVQTPYQSAPSAPQSAH